MLNALLWIAAVVLAIFGIMNLFDGAILWGVVLLLFAALIGPGGSVYVRR
ncbi:MAG: hypothetical protein KAZ88_09250 [Acidimicrobiia bacterium]|jgi:lipoprotein signal peptidase|nr:hypothetical protein [Acidimicrobiia bacterium]MBP8181164.1 hypothetical protein [Acidimicrobiia bacterium]